MEAIAKALSMELADLWADSKSSQPSPPPPLVGRVRRTEDIELPIYQAHAGSVDLARASGTADTFRIRASRTFVVDVVGDCLYPSHELAAGDTLMVDTERLPVTGDLVVARIADEAFLAEWLGEKSWVKLTLSDGQLREAREQDVTVLGVVTYRIGKISPDPGRGMPGWMQVHQSKRARKAAEESSEET